MKNKLLLLSTISFLFILSFVAVVVYIKQPVNFCGQTIKEANNPINWHNGAYSPDGCDLSNYKVTK